MVVIPFGKHAGRSAREVFAEDVRYCQWLHGQEIKSKALREFLDEKFGKVSSDEYYMGFGRHKNKSLGEIARTDARYIEFLKSFVTKEKYPKLYERLALV